MVCDSIVLSSAISTSLLFFFLFVFNKKPSSLTVIFPVSTLNRPSQIPYIQCTTVRVVFCLPTGTPIISLVLLSGKHGNVGSCQIDPTEGAVWPFSLFNKEGSYEV